jgi:hypothetical protein
VVRERVPVWRIWSQIFCSVLNQVIAAPHPDAGWTCSARRNSSGMRRQRAAYFFVDVQRRVENVPIRKRAACRTARIIVRR